MGIQTTGGGLTPVINGGAFCCPFDAIFGVILLDMLRLTYILQLRLTEKVIEMKLTEAEARVFDRLKDIEPVKHGYGFRWRFKGSLEPVTKEIRAMQKKGLLEVKGTAFGPQVWVHSDA